MRVFNLHPKVLARLGLAMMLGSFMGLVMTGTVFAASGSGFTLNYVEGAALKWATT